MARVFGLLLAFIYVSSVAAAPLETRQLGGVACNVARLKTVAGLRQTTKAVNKLAASSDPAAADAAATAQGGLQDASDGIKTIAGALLKGQAAPAASRDQVAQGLMTAQDALSNITSTDTAVTSQVADAQSKLENTISAGQDVISKCGGGGADASTGDATATDTGDATATNTGDATATDTGDATATNTGDATATDTGSTDTSDATATGSDASGTGATDSTATGSSSNTGSETDGSSADSTGTTADNTSDGSAVDNASSGSSRNGSNGGGLNALAGLRNSRIFGKRQIGGIACNVARFQTVGRLAQSSASVKAVKKAAAADPATAAAADTASTALNSAKGGIAKIAVSLVAGQKAPAADRDQVEKGLNDAMTALASVNSTDPNVTSAISAAQDKVSSTLEAGQRVVSSC